MATKSNSSLGMLILQISLAIFLITFGIAGIQGNTGLLGDIKGAFGGNSTLNLVFGICELIAGILLILNLFNISALSGFVDIILLVIIIVWAAHIVMQDFSGIGNALNSSKAFLKWLRILAPDLLALSGLLIIKGI